MSSVETVNSVLPEAVRDRLAPFGPVFARVSLGLILIPHGYAKLFQDDAIGASRNFTGFGWAYPLAWAYAIGALEFFGGLMLVVGLLTRLVALAFAIEMAVISLAVLYPVWTWGKHGMEYSVFMGLIAVSILMWGGGKYSLDRRLGWNF